MHSVDGVTQNVERIAALFPNCVTERKGENGEVERAIDFDMLRQELSRDIIDTGEERYQFTWPGKREAIRLANSPIAATLRPVREDSVDFDNTQNLYIEGDNLDVLKLLRETYLGKVKMIYIDPPYNTGNDFVYEDDFSQTSEDYLANSGQYDEQGNRLVANTESNGRFHTDWLNMIYPRLKVARDLLSNNGIICISINDYEIENLRKICDEIFGQSNFISQLVWKNKYGAGGGTNSVASIHEYVLIYTKSPLISITCSLSEELSSSYSQKDEKFDRRGGYVTQPLASTSKGARVNLMYTIHHNGFEIHPPKGGRWIWSKEKFDQAYANNEIVINQTANGFSVRFKQYLYDENGIKRRGTQLSMISDVFNQEGSKEFADLMGDKRFFDFPKPTRLIKKFLDLRINDEDNSDAIILDFFSGSATTAHAVMQLNAEDGGNRKFIMVQLPEVTDENSEARKAGYANICEIGKERIRRAGKKIKAEHPEAKDLDIGFRVLRLDSSNMEDVYYTPDKFDPTTLIGLLDNVKSDRTDEDLLFQVMLELDVPLSASIKQEQFAGKNVFVVADGHLIATFDKDVNESTVTEIAKRKPNFFVMRDASAANDNVLDNFEQIFRHYSPDTDCKIL